MVITVENYESILKNTNQGQSPKDNAQNSQVVIFIWGSSTWDWRINIQDRRWNIPINNSKCSERKNQCLPFWMPLWMTTPITHHQIVDKSITTWKKQISNLIIYHSRFKIWLCCSSLVLDCEGIVLENQQQWYRGWTIAGRDNNTIDSNARILTI